MIINGRRVLNSQYFIAAILAFVIAAPMRFWIGAIPSFAIVDLLILSVAAIYLAIACLEERLYVISKAVFVILALPLVAACISLTWTINFAMSVKALVVYVEALCGFLAVVYLSRRARFESLEFFIILLAVSLIAVAALSYTGISFFHAQIPPGFDSAELVDFNRSYAARLSHPYIGLSNNFASVLAFLPFFIFGLKRVKARQIYSILLVMVLLAIFLTQSRGVLLALLLVLPFFLKSRGVKVLTIVFACILLLAVFVAIFFFSGASDVLGERISGRFSEGNIVSRITLFILGIESFLNRPIVGYGAGVNLGSIVGTEVNSVHNFALEQLLYFGAPLGGAIVLSLFALPFVISRIPVRSKEGEEMRSALSYALFAQLILLLSQASFEGSLLRVYFYLLVGLGIALIRGADARFAKRLVRITRHAE